MSYTISFMETVDEINGKAYVHFKSWHETYTGLVSSAYLDTVTQEKCLEIAHRWPSGILVAKDGSRVIGFVGYGSYRDDSLPGYGEIYALYVLADYQHQGVGYELMNAALRELSAYDRIALWVLKGNLPAIRFYERFGFRFDQTEQEILLGTPCVEQRMVYVRA